MTTKHLKKWAPGESGNPTGRPAGAKNRLQIDFLQALAEDFREHGRNLHHADRAPGGICEGRSLANAER
jgi:hypothetical protein